MSIFQGKLDEVPEISIDRFDGENLKSTAYFLTHCHTDHMVGLGMDDFRKALFERDDVYLYTSEISFCILKNHDSYRHLVSKIKPLSCVGCKILSIPSLTDPNTLNDLQVTLIPAGHCPGSVMFFFELQQGNLLYTGDIRLTLDNICSLADLHHKDGTPKEIRALYLDATFFDDLHPSFPKREESFQEICKLSKEWLQKSPDNEVSIDIAANYGAEFIYCELKKELGMKVHVPPRKATTFAGVKEISAAITSDGKQTRIHACAVMKQLPFGCLRRKDKFLTIRVSCLWYEKDYADKGVVHEKLSSKIRVCYACHCSKKELVDFLEYFLPEKVVACAIPRDRTTDEVEKEIMDLIRACKRSRSNDSSDTPDDHKISYSLMCQVKRKLMASPRKKRSFPCISPVLSSDESSPLHKNSHITKLNISSHQEDIIMDKSLTSESPPGENNSEKMRLSTQGDLMYTLGKQRIPSEKTEVTGGSYESDSSPSLLPQFSPKIMDPTARTSWSPDCYLVYKSQEETEIEVITLSSDDSPEIFVMD